MYAFLVYAHARPERADAFEQLFRRYIAPSRDESGCIQYHMLRDAQDPTLFVFHEVWASRDALDAHMALPHMRQFHAQRMEYLSQELDIREVEVIDPV